ncbi:MAG: hypothetical protein ACJAW0_001481 [Zhongshania sp.]|jgi:hypothetical protein
MDAARLASLTSKRQIKEKKLKLRTFIIKLPAADD